MSDLTGRTALVTGAASGIGRAVARALATDGSTVVCADLNPAGLDETVALIEQAGGTAIAVALDLTDAAAVDALVHAPTLDGLEQVGGSGFLEFGVGRKRARTIHAKATTWYYLKHITCHNVLL